MLETSWINRTHSFSDQVPKDNTSNEEENEKNLSENEKNSTGNETNPTDVKPRSSKPSDRDDVSQTFISDLNDDVIN